MATVPNPRLPRNTITHYVYYGDVYGTATLLNGTGYLFRAEGARQAVLVSYKDPALLLLGRVDVADAQHEVDLLVGGPAMVACSRQMEV